MATTIRCRKCGGELPRELGAGVKHLATCDPGSIYARATTTTSNPTTEENDR